LCGVEDGAQGGRWPDEIRDRADGQTTLI
jgi:hypothetical protein